MQGRDALYNLLSGGAEWPPVVVPFGLDPWGWHGARSSYNEVCNFALENCTLLPKVYPFEGQLAIGKGGDGIHVGTSSEADGTEVRRYTIENIPGGGFFMEEVRTPGDSSWKNRRRWLENENELERFIGESGRFSALEPNIAEVRSKEKDVGSHGLPYAECFDPFYTASEMMPTDMFFILLRQQTVLIRALIDSISKRILAGIEMLCRDTGCPFILRLVGAEMAAPPFLSRDDFILFLAPFYREAKAICSKYEVPVSFHCHGPVRDIIDDVWEMGYDLMEPFEPAPRGNVTIGEALSKTDGRGIVFGGVDDVLFNSGTSEEVRLAVESCLDDARGAGMPFILSQSCTPFHDPLPEHARNNILLFMSRGIEG